MYYIYSAARVIVGDRYASYMYADPPAEVVPGIFIGSAASVQCVRECGINYVVSMVGVVPSAAVTCSFPIEDVTITPENFHSIAATARAAAEAIRELSKLGRVLVHCAAGVNRSAFALGIYLLGAGYGYDDAIGALEMAAKKRRVYCLTNNSFRTYLKMAASCQKLR